MPDHTSGPRTEADAIIQVTQQGFEPRTVGLVDAGGTERDVLVLPNGLSAHSTKKLTDEYRTTPERRVGVASLDDVGSFIEWVNRHKDKGSTIFADRSDEPELVAIIDYNHAGEEPTSGTLARFRTHRGVYRFPVSDEWEAWTDKDKVVMSQRDFAEFIEGHVADLDVGPANGMAATFQDKLACDFASPSRIVELSRGMAIKDNVQVKQSIRLDSGESQILYQNTHTNEDGSPLSVPGGFLIAIPVFKREAPFQLAVRLRHRVKEGSVVWWFELYRPELAFDVAFDEAARQVSESTNLPLFLGRPEP